MSLLEIQSQWIRKFDEMSIKDTHHRLAAPFLSISDERTAVTRRGTIMLVGKATNKSWELEEFLSFSDRPIQERVEERCSVTRKHLENMRKKPSSAFWRFWRKLHEIGSPVIWTNLAKIGTITRNPGCAVLDAQKELACETLKAEICEYKPSLVVITGDYAKNIIYSIWPQKDWTISEYDRTTCWIRRDSLRPSVLWVDHPERKRKERISLWLEKARELLL